MKHAYLILAHSNFGILQRLIEASDDPRVDIYIHFDAKSKDIPSLHAAHSRLYVLNDRIDVRWAGYSMVEAELRLCETALENGPYDYYHLLSGVDLPLRSVASIDRFYSANAGKEFIGFAQGDLSGLIDWRVRHLHLFRGSFRPAPGIAALAQRVCRAAFLRMQYLFGIRVNRDVEFRKGCQWFSITDEMARFFVSSRDCIRKTYRHAFCPDEIVLQTLAWNSSFRESLYNVGDEARGCMREISWRDGVISDWRDEDFMKLSASEAMFSRKFGPETPGLVNNVLKLQENR